MAKKNKDTKQRKHIAISADIHAELLKYCGSQPQGGKIYLLAEKLFKDFLASKGIFLP